MPTLRLPICSVALLLILCGTLATAQEKQQKTDTAEPSTTATEPDKTEKSVRTEIRDLQEAYRRLELKLARTRQKLIETDPDIAAMHAEIMQKLRAFDDELDEREPVKEVRKEMQTLQTTIQQLKTVIE